MKRTVEQGGGDFLTMEELDEGVYVGRLESVEDHEIKDSPYGPAYRWVWALFDGDEEIGPLTEITSQSFTPKSNTFARYAALMGGGPEVGASVDLEDMVGNFARLLVKENPNRKGFAKVTEILPAREGDMPEEQEEEEAETEEEEVEEGEDELPTAEEIDAMNLAQAKEAMNLLEVPWSGGSVTKARSSIKEFLGYPVEAVTVKKPKRKSPPTKTTTKKPAKKGAASRVLNRRKK